MSVRKIGTPLNPKATTLPVGTIVAGLRPSVDGPTNIAMSKPQVQYLVPGTAAYAKYQAELKKTQTLAKVIDTTFAVGASLLVGPEAGVLIKAATALGTQAGTPSASQVQSSNPYSATVASMPQAVPAATSTSQLTWLQRLEKLFSLSYWF